MNLLEKLRNFKTKGTLPGVSGWNPMKPESRNRFPNWERLGEVYKEAAVLILLCEEDGELYFPLIKRIEDGSPHSGQIALPGGGLDDNESPEEAALRETEEEIGIDRKDIEILFKLTPLPIPVSSYKVHPFVGLFKGKTPSWIPDTKEVERVCTMKMREFLDPAIRKREAWTFGDKSYEIPFFFHKKSKIWGATAMILSEFSEVVKSLN